MLTKFDKNVNIYLYFKERSDKNDENLDKYLKNIQNGNLCCNTFGCNNCLKCSDALKSIVIKQDGLEKWKKIFEDRLEKYRNE
mgnify:CR=1 FL=1